MNEESKNNNYDDLRTQTAGLGSRSETASSPRNMGSKIDKVSGASRKSAAAEKSVKYNSNKNNKNNKRNKKSNPNKKVNKLALEDSKTSLRTTWILIAIISLLLLAITVALIYQLNQQKQEFLAEQADLELQLEKSKEEEIRINQMEAMVGEKESIEAIAGNKLGMVRDDEIVFIDID